MPVFAGERVRMRPAGLRDGFARVEELAANTLLMSRQELFRQLSDPRRDVDDECGFPRLTESINIDLFRQLFEREDIAARVVEVLPEEMWQALPTVFESEDASEITPFEAAVDSLSSNLQDGQSWYRDQEANPIWEHLKRLDILSGIGHFGIMLLGLDDGQSLDVPVEGVTVVANNADGEKKYFRDSYMTVNEQSKLEKLNALTDIERGAIDRLQKEREAINAWQETVNVAKAKAERVINSPTTNSSLRAAANLIKQLDPGKDWDNYGYQSSGATSGWRSSYPQLSGTDQQYFGVQFGPSEQMSPIPAKTGRRLLFLRAFDESLVQIVRYEWNIRNPRFGQPVMYRVTLNDPREQHSGIGLPLATVFVHWSRVIHVADNRMSSEIFGVPRMRPVLNRLLSIRKLLSASPEGYWRTCFTGLSLETNPALGGDVVIDKAKTMDQLEQYMNGLQKFLLLSGMSAKTIAPNVVDPTPHYNIQVEAICIKIACPIRVFKGSERGELASSQDDSKWNDRIRGRQILYGIPRIIVPFFDRLISVGVLPQPKSAPTDQSEPFPIAKPVQPTGKGGGAKPPTGNADEQAVKGSSEGEVGQQYKQTRLVIRSQFGYSVEWPDLESLGDQEKAQIALTKTQCVTTYISAGGEQLIAPMSFLTRFLDFDEEEAREMLEEAEDHQDDVEEQASEDGFEKAPPPGFQDPDDSDDDGDDDGDGDSDGDDDGDGDGDDDDDSDEDDDS